MRFVAIDRKITQGTRESGAAAGASGCGPCWPLACSKAGRRFHSSTSRSFRISPAMFHRRCWPCRRRLFSIRLIQEQPRLAPFPHALSPCAVRAIEIPTARPWPGIFIRPKNRECLREKRMASGLRKPSKPPYITNLETSPSQNSLTDSAEEANILTVPRRCPESILGADRMPLVFAHVGSAIVDQPQRVAGLDPFRDIVVKAGHVLERGHPLPFINPMLVAYVGVERQLVRNLPAS